MIGLLKVLRNNFTTQFDALRLLTAVMSECLSVDVVEEFTVITRLPISSLF